MFERAQSAWCGAQWIGADRPLLDSASLVVFRIRARIRIPAGSTTATLLLGANDFRLGNAIFNEFGLSGPHHLSCSFDVTDPEAPKVTVRRLGYAPDDHGLTPIVQLARTNSNVAHLLAAESTHDEHEIEIVCWSSMLSITIDGRGLELSSGQSQFTVNPRGSNDVASFPNLAEVGFAALPGERYVIRHYEIRTFRDPKTVLFDCRDFDIFKGLEGVTVDGDTITVDGGGGGTLVHRDPSRGALPVLRRDVVLDGPPKHAKVYVTARGIYELAINGNRVGQDWFNPGAGDYRYTVEYSAYDVTALLGAGSNTITATLAPGWWSDMASFLRVNTGFFGDRPSLLLKLVIEDHTGMGQVVVSDPERWRVRTDGPAKSGSFFQGERYDARDAAVLASTDGWSTAELVVPLERNARPAIVAKPDPTVQVFETLVGELVGETRPDSDSWVYDMGVNMVGVPEIDLDLPAGKTIVIRTAEMLYPELEEYRKRGLDGLLMTENLREALSTDFYITSDGQQTFRPRFTFHGYRFVEISGTGGPLAAGAVRGAVLSSLREISGTVSTSNPSLNQLMKNIERSQIGNFISIPTDCPQRNERLGWLEGVTEFARTSCFTSDVDAFYARFLRILRDSQVTDELLATKTDLSGLHSNNGKRPFNEPDDWMDPFSGRIVTGMYPSYVPGYDAYRSWGTPWSSAGVLVPHELYKHYGDTTVIRESFNSMRNYLEAMELLRLPGSSALSADGGTCGDWLSLDKPPYLYIDATVYAHTLACFSDMAAAIGETDVADAYAEKYAAARAEWNELYIDPVTGGFREEPSLVNTSQSSCTLALFYGLPFEQYRGAIFQALCKKVEEGYGGTPYGITTGLFTTPMINLVLSDFGRSDLAYAMIENREYPSWLYPVMQGATSMWERWDSFTAAAGFGGNNGMNSFNHFSLGGVGAWLFNRVGGIDRDPRHVGMQRILLHPEPGGSLRSAEASTVTDYGRVQTAWAWSADRSKWTYACRIPANTSATIELPWATATAPEPHALTRPDSGFGARYVVPAGVWTVAVQDGSARLSEATPESHSLM